jgi:hypothetical protein
MPLYERKNDHTECCGGATSEFKTLENNSAIHTVRRTNLARYKGPNRMDLVIDYHWTRHPLLYACEGVKRPSSTIPACYPSRNNVGYCSRLRGDHADKGIYINSHSTTRTGLEVVFIDCGGGSGQGRRYQPASTGYQRGWRRFWR